jgi:hypothetical protein
MATLETSRLRPARNISLRAGVVNGVNGTDARR